MQPEYLTYALWSLAALLIAVGFIGCIFPIPGHLSILAGLSLISYDKNAPWWVYALLSALCLAGLLVDNIFTYYGCKKFGSSKQGLWCSLIGLLIGSFFFPFGLLIGPFLGAFLAELLWVRRSLKESGNSGIGAVLGFVAGTFAKVIIGMMMCVAVWLCI